MTGKQFELPHRTHRGGSPKTVQAILGCPDREERLNVHIDTTPDSQREVFEEAVEILCPVAPNTSDSTLKEILN